MSARVGTLLFVGLGLIGGSLAAALRGTGFAARMTAFNRNRATLDYALGAGLIDAVPESLEEAIAEADLIVVGHKHLDGWAARWWRGSSSGTLIEHAHCSVLVAITS